MRQSALLKSLFILPGSLLCVPLLLSGCAQKPIVPHAAPPNPFGYQRVSAVCRISPVTRAADGTSSVTMTVRSDDGLCAVPVEKPGGGNYASFGVNPPPEHGKAFLYNYDGKTYVNYTPATAYAGTDAFTVELIPGGGTKREHLVVNATVDATGVVVAKPAVTAPTPPSETAKKTVTRRRATGKTGAKKS